MNRNFNHLNRILSKIKSFNIPASLDNITSASESELLLILTKQLKDEKGYKCEAQEKRRTPWSINSFKLILSTDRVSLTLTLTDYTVETFEVLLNVAGEKDLITVEKTFSNRRAFRKLQRSFEKIREKFFEVQKAKLRGKLVTLLKKE